MARIRRTSSTKITGYNVEYSSAVKEHELRKAHSTDTGFDLQAALQEPLTIESGKIALVNTGVQLALPAGLDAQVRSCSGLAAKHGLWVLNSPGTIDNGYRGEVKVILANLGSKAYAIQPGERIAQLVFSEVIPVEMFRLSEIETTTDRGEGGFGSTGKTTFPKKSKS